VFSHGVLNLYIVHARSRGLHPQGPARLAFKVSDPSALAALTKEMLSLQGKCLRDGKPYIKSLHGGRQASPEAAAADVDVVFIMEMERQEHLDYYLTECPAHAAFKKVIRADPNHSPSNVVTVDFEDGNWPM